MTEMMKMLMIVKSTWRLEEEQQLQLPPVEQLPAELRHPEKKICEIAAKFMSYHDLNDHHRCTCV